MLVISKFEILRKGIINLSNYTRSRSILNKHIINLNMNEEISLDCCAECHLAPTSLSLSASTSILISSGEVGVTSKLMKCGRCLFAQYCSKGYVIIFIDLFMIIRY